MLKELRRVTEMEIVLVGAVAVFSSDFFIPFVITTMQFFFSDSEAPLEGTFFEIPLERAFCSAFLERNSGDVGPFCVP